MIAYNQGPWSESSRSDNRHLLLKAQQASGLRGQALNRTMKMIKDFSANARLTNHTGADLVAIPPSWEVVTKQKIAESRRKFHQAT